MTVAHAHARNSASGASAETGQLGGQPEKRLICPKCGKPAYYGKITERRKRVGPLMEVKVYHYRRYYHYVGSKKSVSLKRLEAVLRQNLEGPKAERILVEAKRGAGVRRIEHYWSA